MTRISLAMPLALLAACAGGDKAGTDSGGPATGLSDQHSTVVVVTQSLDYATGAFATVDLDDHGLSDEIFPVAGDAAVRVSAGQVFQLNRYGYDSLRRYSPGRWGAPDWEVEVGDLANPVDARVCAGRLFVSLYGRDHLGVYDPDSGLLTGTVDLSAWADTDAVGPEPERSLVVGDRLYVGLNRMNRTVVPWLDDGGVVVEVDCTSATATRSWPVGAGTRVMDRWGDRVLAGGAAHGDQPAGIYAIDPDGNEDLVLDLTEIGEIPLFLGVVGDQALLISRDQDYGWYSVGCLDLPTGHLTPLEQTPAHLQDLAINDRGEAWVAAHWGWIDPDAVQAGLWVYDVAACAVLVDAPIQTSLGPVAVDFY